MNQIKRRTTNATKRSIRRNQHQTRLNSLTTIQSTTRNRTVSHIHTRIITQHVSRLRTTQPHSTQRLQQRIYRPTRTGLTQSQRQLTRQVIRNSPIRPPPAMIIRQRQAIRNQDRKLTNRRIRHVPRTQRRRRISNHLQQQHTHRLRRIRTQNARTTPHTPIIRLRLRTNVQRTDIKRLITRASTNRHNISHITRSLTTPSQPSHHNSQIDSLILQKLQRINQIITSIRTLKSTNQQKRIPNTRPHSHLNSTQILRRHARFKPHIHNLNINHHNRRMQRRRLNIRRLIITLRSHRLIRHSITTNRRPLRLTISTTLTRQQMTKHRMMRTTTQSTRYRQIINRHSTSQIIININSMTQNQISRHQRLNRQRRLMQNNLILLTLNHTHSRPLITTHTNSITSRPQQHNVNHIRILRIITRQSLNQNRMNSITISINMNRILHTSIRRNRHLTRLHRINHTISTTRKLRLRNHTPTHMLRQRAAIPTSTRRKTIITPQSSSHSNTIRMTSQQITHNIIKRTIRTVRSRTLRSHTRQLHITTRSNHSQRTRKIRSRLLLRRINSINQVSHQTPTRTQHTTLRSTQHTKRTSTSRISHNTSISLSLLRNQQMTRTRIQIINSRQPTNHQTAKHSRPRITTTTLTTQLRHKPRRQIILSQNIRTLRLLRRLQVRQLSTNQRLNPLITNHTINQARTQSQSTIILKLQTQSILRRRHNTIRTNNNTSNLMNTRLRTTTNIRIRKRIRNRTLTSRSQIRQQPQFNTHSLSHQMLQQRHIINRPRISTIQMKLRPTTNINQRLIPHHFNHTTRPRHTHLRIKNRHNQARSLNRHTKRLTANRIRLPRTITHIHPTSRRNHVILNHHTSSKRTLNIVSSTTQNARTQNNSNLHQDHRNSKHGNHNRHSQGRIA